MFIFVSLLFSLENKKLAETGFQFLSVASDARSGGMAETMTTMHSNSASMFFNPAGLSRQNQFFDINLSSNEWIAGINHDAVSFSFSPKNGKFGCVGFSLLNVDYGELQGTMVWDNDQGFIDTDKFSPSVNVVTSPVLSGFKYFTNNVIGSSPAASAVPTTKAATPDDAPVITLLT